ncbi:MAG: putative toxin-antitoxin system toxin component, PIN family [Treponema sp.]|nr:putative toxin-antitoxin system toxin component, PIN family [Treponema sp.]
MLDTNVLVSAAILSSPGISRLVDEIACLHTVVLSTYILDELKRVVRRKFPEKYGLLENFLRELPFELAYTPEKIDASKYPSIRDDKDLPVLASAIDEDVDVLLSGDGDFSPLEMRRPEILTPGAFLKLYGR